MVFWYDSTSTHTEYKILYLVDIMTHGGNAIVYDPFGDIQMFLWDSILVDIPNL